MDVDALGMRVDVGMGTAIVMDMGMEGWTCGYRLRWRFRN